MRSCAKKTTFKICLLDSCVTYVICKLKKNVKKMFIRFSIFKIFPISILNVVFFDSTFLKVYYISTFLLKVKISNGIKISEFILSIVYNFKSV